MIRDRVSQPAVWFPTIRAGSGTDVFTERLCAGLQARGIRAEITWLPLRAEYAPWTVPIPKPPEWANVVHINSWLHPRFVPRNLPTVVTVHHSVHDPAFMPYKTTAQKFYHRFWIRPIEARNVRCAAVVTAVSRHVAAQVKKLFGRTDVAVIYNGIDVEHTFTPGPKPDPLWPPSSSSWDRTSSYSIRRTGPDHTPNTLCPLIAVASAASPPPTLSRPIATPTHCFFHRSQKASL